MNQTNTIHTFQIDYEIDKDNAHILIAKDTEIENGIVWQNTKVELSEVELSELQNKGIVNANK